MENSTEMTRPHLAAAAPVPSVLRQSWRFRRARYSSITGRVHEGLPPRVLSCGRTDLTARRRSRRAERARQAQDRWPAVKFRVERDVLAEAVTWVARGLPARPPVPVLAGLLIEADDDGTLTLSASTTRSRPGSPSRPRSPRPAPSWSPAACWPTSRATCPAARSTSPPTGQVSVTCGSLALHPADDAGRRLPDAADVARERRGTIAGDVFTQAVAQVSIAADRGDTLPILTGVRIEIDGDTITLLATDRYRLAMRELTGAPGARRQPRRAHPGPHALRHGQGARRLRLVELALAGRRRRRARSASRPVSAARRPGCSTASTPRSPRSSPPTSTPRRSSRPPRCRGGQARRPGRRAQHPGAAEVHRRARSPSRPAGRRRPGLRGGRGHLHGDEIEIAFNPQFLLDGLGASAPPFAPAVVHRSRASPPCSPARPRRTASADDSYRYVLMPVRFAS